MWFWNNGAAEDLKGTYVHLETNGDLTFTALTDGYGLASQLITMRHNGNIGINMLAAVAKLHIDQSVGDAAIPVLILDQADISEGFINFIGSDRGVIDEGVSSVESVRVEVNGVVRRLAVYADA